MKNLVAFNTGKNYDLKIAFNVDHIICVEENDSGHAIIKTTDGITRNVDQNFEGALIKIRSAMRETD